MYWIQLNRQSNYCETADPMAAGIECVYLYLCMCAVKPVSQAGWLLRARRRANKYLHTMCVHRVLLHVNAGSAQHHARHG
jgi:hypothetical protein